VKPPAHKASTWSGYATQNSYSSEQAQLKQTFIADAVARYKPQTVLDIGCNTGQFSMIAARGGASVVSIDYDPVVVGSLWSAARAENLDILPLVVNLGRPTPATGWRNEEFPSFLERARERFDAILMLAVLHHLLVTERVPLDSVLETAAEMTRDLLIIEFVGTDDPMFRKIARGREALHAGLTPASFEAAASLRFELVRRDPIPGSSRILYIYKKKQA
jgi:SAM-dependent methyltransferase